MTYPWPGMNPWLENHLLWRSVHHSLISALQDYLAPLLRPRYFVAIDKRPLVSLLPDALPEDGPGDYSVVHLELETIEVGYLEVCLVPHGEVVTVIELLSYSNKLPVHDREVYIRKREELLQTAVGFVEIDLLRAGQPMPLTELPASDYRLFIRRREQPFQARLYPFGVRKAIPTFRLPLLPGDTEPTVDLGSLIKGVYERAGYDLVIDYSQPPVPPLNEADAAWAADVLKAHS